MFRPALRLTARPASSSLRIVSPRVAARRFLSTAPPHQKSRSWKSSFTRWGVAGAVVYYYNTATIFADESADAVHVVPDLSRHTETLETVETVSEQRRAQAQARAQPKAQALSNADHSASVAGLDAIPSASGSPEDLEAEADQQGAFDEETGEINWDCPCLGGMAHGPCGEQFRAAFSCFVFSQEEPKGVDCIDKFRGMQDCFREHPEVYGSELELDEDEAPLFEGDEPPSGSYTAEPTTQSADVDHRSEKVADHHTAQSDSEEAISGKRARAEAAKEQVRSNVSQEVSEAPGAVPKSAHDAR